MNGTRETRQILRSLFTPGSRKFCRLSTNDARLLYVGLLLNAADDGSVDCDRKSLRNLFPWWPEKGRKQYQLIRRLVSVGLLEITQSGQVSIVGFAETQRAKADRKTQNSEEAANPENESRKTLQKDTPAYIDSSFFLSKEEEKKKEGMNEAGSGVRGEGPGSGEVFRQAKRRFRNVARRSFGSLGKLGGRWSVLVSRNSPEIVIRAVEMFAEHVRDSEMDHRFPPLPTFLNQSAQWIEDAEDEAEERTEKEKSIQIAPIEELVEWRGVKMTRKEMERFKCEEEEAQKRKAERERQKPWEPPMLEEGEKVQ